nr:MAG TPA: hypothetical protein [Caudoviricetes sp.]
MLFEDSRKFLFFLINGVKYYHLFSFFHTQLLNYIIKNHIINTYLT